MYTYCCASQLCDGAGCSLVLFHDSHSKGGSQCLKCRCPVQRVITVPSSSRLRLSVALSGEGVPEAALVLLSDPLLPLAGRVPLALIERAEVELAAERRFRCGS